MWPTRMRRPRASATASLLTTRRYVSQIGVAEHRRHRRQPTEPIEDAGADIAAMDDPLRPREQVVEQRDRSTRAYRSARR